MRLPNGFGSVYKLPGRRRKPWAARITVGWQDFPEKLRSYPVYKFIGYYETRQEALTALVDYNKNPYDLHAGSITFEDVYDKWSDRKFADTSDASISSYKTAYQVCKKLYKMRFVDIKLSHLQMVVDESGKNTPTLKKVKSLFSQLFEYSIIHEIISKERNLVQYVDIKKAGNPNALHRQPFSKKEIETVWAHKDANEYVSVILMLIYTGVRIGELLDLKKEDVHLEERWFFVKESKTESGVRAVPIAEKVYLFFDRWTHKNTCEHLLSSPDGKHFEYRNYYDSYWTPLVDMMGMSHRPHDTRHTCISLLTVAGVSDKAIKKIVGHKGQSTTEIVYTHFAIQDLLEAINKI